MSEPAKPNSKDRDLGERIVYWLAISLIIVGLANSMPGIPGLDAAFEGFLGYPNFVIRKFPYEYFYPLAFAVMMTIVALKHSLWRDLAQASRPKRLMGLGLDVALVIAAMGISITYVVEIEAICAIDQLTGERAELIARSLAEEREFADLYGLPIPDSVEDPQCIN
ncbi:MAG: C4-dicarboxylate ABC transporter, partial [Rhizobiaceae bacterium]|nr:C4-dicarboxylate ABC transporter [Rhizobiaceae bacterium]